MGRRALALVRAGSPVPAPPPHAVCIWQLGAGAMPSAASQLVSRRYAGAAASGANLRANSGQEAARAGSHALRAAAGQRTAGRSSACTNTSRAPLRKRRPAGSESRAADDGGSLEAAGEVRRMHCCSAGCRASGVRPARPVGTTDSGDAWWRVQRIINWGAEAVSSHMVMQEAALCCANSREAAAAHCRRRRGGGGARERAAVGALGALLAKALAQVLEHRDRDRARPVRARVLAVLVACAFGGGTSRRACFRLRAATHAQRLPGMGATHVMRQLPGSMSGGRSRACMRSGLLARQAASSRWQRVIAGARTRPELPGETASTQTGMSRRQASASQAWSWHSAATPPRRASRTRPGLTWARAVQAAHTDRAQGEGAARQGIG